MSGICGIVNFDGAPVDPEILKKMAEAAAYRGPDGITYWIEGNVGLAHLALHTTPESLREKQPLHNSKNDAILIADARVDNRDELIRTLTAKGTLQDKDPTDAELILAAYECWGDDCPEHIIGDFAFAIWDQQKNRLFCARDPFGVKPLHYAQRGNVLCISSEAQQATYHPAVSRRLDEVALADHLVNNRTNEGRSFFSGVRWLPAAHHMVASATGMHLERYWDVDNGTRITYANDDDYAAHFLDIFRRAVADRLRTQAGTIGIFMSGGLDSTSIAAVAQQMIAQDAGLPQLLACSYAFDQLKECDERDYSELMADELGVEIEYVNAEEYWLLGDLIAFQPRLEAPAMTWESLDHHVLKRLESRRAKVVLTGQTIFYSRLGGSAVVYAHRLLCGEVGVLWELLQYCREQNLRYRDVAFSRIVVPLLSMRVIQTARCWLTGRDVPSPIPEWLATGFAQRTNLAERLSEPRCPFDVTRRVNYQRAVWLGGIQCTAYIYDRMVKSHAMEARHPFLDRRLVEFLMAIPPRQGYQAGQNRVILRQAMRNILPEKIRLRQDKTGFNPFIDFSLREKENPKVSELLKTPLLGKLGIVDTETLYHVYQQYQAREGDTSGGGLWFPITLEIWLRQHHTLLESTS